VSVLVIREPLPEAMIDAIVAKLRAGVCEVEIEVPDRPVESALPPWQPLSHSSTPLATVRIACDIDLNRLPPEAFKG